MLTLTSIVSGVCVFSVLKAVPEEDAADGVGLDSLFFDVEEVNGEEVLVSHFCFLSFLSWSLRWSRPFFYLVVLAWLFVVCLTFILWLHYMKNSPQL